jgi:16S rRNA (adenine1518-N6/adenine1519-N6)-dimethyltransferase
MPSALHQRPRKRFAQHFLVRPEVADRIVALANLGGSEAVLEIGPGRGALTARLAAVARELWLVEIDRDLSATLRERFAADPRVHVLEGDILRVDLAALLPSPTVVVANLPYNISTPVLMRLLQAPALFSRLVLMLQREVAARLGAGPGTKTYGALSVMVQLVADVRTAFNVGADAFSPRPRVDSSVVVIEPRQPATLTAAELAGVRRVVRTAFAQRRKQLGNALASLGAALPPALDQLGIDPRRRPETLSAGEFVALAHALETHA